MCAFVENLHYKEVLYYLSSDGNSVAFVSTRKRPLDTTSTECQTDEKRMKRDDTYTIAYHSVRLTQSGMVHQEPLINQSDSTFGTLLECMSNFLLSLQTMFLSRRSSLLAPPVRSSMKVISFRYVFVTNRIVDFRLILS